MFQSGSLVAMVFKEEIKGNVTLKVEQTDLQLTTKRENATVFTFSAPRKCMLYVLCSLLREEGGEMKKKISNNKNKEKNKGEQDEELVSH